ncbi:MAG: thiamine-phosphate kinase [bacterium]
MNLSKIGEMGVYKNIVSQFSTEPSSHIIKGIGDDCAIVMRDNDSNMFDIISTDMLVEHTHFLKDRISAYQLGYKALAANLSDIAAMGGRPKYVALSLGLPRDTSSEWLNDFLSGFKYLAGQYNVVLIGGDTIRSTVIVINMTMMGVVAKTDAKLISAAKVDDVVCVTGYVGDSGGGLRLILDENHLVHSDVTRYLVNAHYRPHVYLEEGEWLSRQAGVNGMTDVSDGVGGEVKWMSELAGVGFSVELTKLPISAQLKKISKIFTWDPLHLALNGGEDYCLFVTIDKKKFEYIRKQYEEKFKSPLWEIGRVTQKTSGIEYTYNNEVVPVFADGYDNFL